MTVYEKNLAAMRGKFPDVYEWIVREKEDPTIEMVSDERGDQNLRLGDRIRGQYPFYNQEDPREEEGERLRGIQFSPGKVTFLIGVGLGYALEIIRDRIQDGHKIIVLERNAAILKRALHRVDMTSLLQEGKLIFSLPDDHNFRIQIFQHIALTVSQIMIIPGFPNSHLAHQDYRELTEKAYKISNDVMFLKGGTAEDCQEMTLNEIENLPPFLFSPGIKKLFDRYRNVPAFIVSAGPSLDRNIHLLKKAEGKSIIVATAPVVRVLLAHDISPSFVVSVDFHEGNRVHFEGLWDLDHVPLIHPLRITSAVVRFFQGERYCIESDSGWLTQHWETKGSIGISPSVAGWALKAIIAMGCDPIIFIGQDLAYSGLTHVEGSARSRNLNPEKEREQLIQVEGLYGEKVITSNRFSGFLSDLENTISQHKKKYVNCTARGVRIKGMKEMPLGECIAAYCRNPIDVRSVLEQAKGPEEVNFEGLIRNLESNLGEMKNLTVLCRKGHGGARKIQKRYEAGFRDEPVINRLIVENEEIKWKLQNFFSSCPLIPFFICKEIYQVELPQYFYKQDLPWEENLRIFLKRSQMIFPAVEKALTVLRERILRLLETLREFHHLRSQLSDLPSANGVRYRYGTALAKIGLHRLAMEEYLLALNGGEDSSRLFEAMGLSALHLGRLEEARNHFFDAQKRGLDSVSFKKDMNRIETELSGWLERARSFHREGNWVNALLYARKVLLERKGCEEALKIEEEARSKREAKITEMERLNHLEHLGKEEGSGYRQFIAEGIRLIHNQNFPAAIAVLQKSSEIAKDPSEAENLIACCYSELGEMNRAQEIFQKLSAHNPGSGLYLFNWGRALLRNRHLLGAAEKYEQAAEKEEKYHRAFAEAGELWLRAKNYDKAIGCFGRYLATYPRDHEILAKTATCYLAKGMVRDALYKYQEALRIFPAYEPAQKALAKIEALSQWRDPDSKMAGDHPAEVRS